MRPEVSLQKQQNRKLINFFTKLASERRNFDFAFQDTKCGCWMMNLDIMWINMDMKVFGLYNYISWVNQNISAFISIHSESVSTFKFAILFQKYE